MNTAVARTIGLVFLCLVTALPFVAAGSIDWIEGWVFVAVIAAGSVLAHSIVKRRNPELVKHRQRVGMGTKPWDRVWLGLFRLMLLGMLVVAGLDAVRIGCADACQVHSCIIAWRACSRISTGSERRVRERTYEKPIR